MIWYVGGVRIGVVSDTHNHLANVARIVEIFNDADVARVVHTGDITQPKTLHSLANLEVPLVGVYGNNDVDREALDATCATLDLHFVEPPLDLRLAGRRILVTHDVLLLADDALLAVDVLLHGHDHRYANDHSADTLRFNPGECAGHLPGRNAVGILDLETLCCERLFF